MHHEMTKEQLRNFGLLTSALLILFFVLLIPWIWDLSLPVWPWVVGGILSTVALVYPNSLKPVYSVWMRFAELLGWVNTRIILGLIFYVIIMPFGLVMRLFNDPMHRKVENDADSYRKISKSPNSHNLEKPF
jgi:hypothetical protein